MIKPYSIDEHAEFDAANTSNLCVYAWTGEEDGDYVGPCLTALDAIEEFLGQFDPDDENTHIEVTLARGAGMPTTACVSERLSEWAYYDYGERGGDAIDSACKGKEQALDDAVNAAIAAWFEANGGNPLDGFWMPRGCRLETSAGEARAFLAARESATAPPAPAGDEERAGG